MFGPYFWLFLIFSFFTVTLLIIPPHRVQELLSFGLIAGFIWGLLIMYTGTTLFPLFKVNYLLLPVQKNWGLSVPILWIPTVMLFAYFLPKIIDTRWGLYFYIFFFALGSTGFYIFLKTLGYWEDIQWNYFYNIILACSTHSLMTIFLYKTGFIEKYRKNHKPKQGLWNELKNRP